MGPKLWCHRRSWTCSSTWNTEFYFDGQLTPVSLDSLVRLVTMIIPSDNSTMVKWGRVNTLACSNSEYSLTLLQQSGSLEHISKNNNKKRFWIPCNFDPHSKCTFFPIMSVCRTGARKQRGLQCEKEVITEELLWHSSFKRGNSSLLCVYICISVSHMHKHTHLCIYTCAYICKCNCINEIVHLNMVISLSGMHSVSQMHTHLTCTHVTPLSMIDTLVLMRMCNYINEMGFNT